MSPEYNIKDLLPQKGAMALLDELVDVNDDGLTASLTVKRGGLFNRDDGTVPAWVGIEYMAQAIAAYAGYKAVRAGEPVKIGFLLGTRDFQTSVDGFPCGTELTITALKLLEDENGMAAFECNVEGVGVRQTARLNVYQPRDPGKFLEQN